MSNDLFSHKSDEWCTPFDLFLDLDSKYNFTLDPASTDLNHLCIKYYTKDDDGLSKSWKGERVFCNPPYSNVAAWVKKAYEEWFFNNTKTVLLLPARTDTRWFHDLIYNCNIHIEFIRGRLRFSNSTQNAPFPSMLVFYDRVSPLFL